MRLKLLILFSTVAISVPAGAQMVDIPIYSNGILGQQALRNTYDNYNKANGIDPDKGKSARSTSSRACSLDSMPAAERRAMEQEYRRRDKVDGRASANAWIGEQGARFRMKLVAEGVCPPPDRTAARAGKQVADSGRASGKKPLLNKKGQPCTRTRVENRVSPGFGGNAMTMGLVPVCAD